MAWHPPSVAGEDEPTFHCGRCLDESSAWLVLWCPGSGPGRQLQPPERVQTSGIHPCGRLHAHHGHTYAERCACHLTNPVIARRRQHEVRRATARTRKERAA